MLEAWPDDELQEAEPTEDELLEAWPEDELQGADPDEEADEDDVAVATEGFEAAWAVGAK